MTRCNFSTLEIIRVTPTVVLMPKGKGGGGGGGQGKGGAQGKGGGGGQGKGGAQGKGSGKVKDAPTEGAKGGKKTGAGTAVKVGLKHVPEQQKIITYKFCIYKGRVLFATFLKILCTLIEQSHGQCTNLYGLEFEKLDKPENFV